MSQELKLGLRPAAPEYLPVHERPTAAGPEVNPEPRLRSAVPRQRALKPLPAQEQSVAPEAQVPNDVTQELPVIADTAVVPPVAPNSDKTPREKPSSGWRKDGPQAESPVQLALGEFSQPRRLTKQEARERRRAIGRQVAQRALGAVKGSLRALNELPQDLQSAGQALNKTPYLTAPAVIVGDAAPRFTDVSTRIGTASKKVGSAVGEKARSIAVGLNDAASDIRAEYRQHKAKEVARQVREAKARARRAEEAGTGLQIMEQAPEAEPRLDRIKVVLSPGPETMPEAVAQVNAPKSKTSIVSRGQRAVSDAMLRTGDALYHAPGKVLKRLDGRLRSMSDAERRSYTGKILAGVVLPGMISVAAGIVMHKLGGVEQITTLSDQASAAGGLDPSALQSPDVSSLAVPDVSLPSPTPAATPDFIRPQIIDIPPTPADAMPSTGNEFGGMPAASAPDAAISTSPGISEVVPEAPQVGPDVPDANTGVGSSVTAPESLPKEVTLGKYNAKTGEGTIWHIAKDAAGFGDVREGQLSPEQMRQVIEHQNRILELNFPDVSLSEARQLAEDLSFKAKIKVSK